MNDIPNGTTSKVPETADAQDARQRSPRLRLEASMLVYSWGENGQPFYDDAKTVEVSAYGGLLATPRTLGVGQSILLIHPVSGDQMTCHVRFSEPAGSGVYHVGIAFETKSAEFWGVEFPADDGEIRGQAAVQRAAPVESAGEEVEPLPHDDEVAAASLPEVTDVAESQTKAPEADPKIDREQQDRGAAPPQAAPPRATASRTKATENSKGSAATPVSGSTFGEGLRRIERRAHMRHKIAAAAELTEAESGKSVKARISSLSRDGCYVQIDHPFPTGAVLKVSVTKDAQSFQAQAQVVYSLAGKGMGLVFTAVEPEQYEVLDKWFAASRETSWLASNRRRSHRIMLQVPVKIAGTNGLGEKFVEETNTESVSVYGALVLLATEVVRGQILTITSLRTKAALECSVVYLGQNQGSRREVGVSFTEANRSFWQVSFPPGDWSTHHPDARGT